jgi:phosphoglycolate phosphatase
MTTLTGCTIAFDLDGTLVDTAPDLHRALAVVMRTEGLPPASLHDVRAFVGQGAHSLIVRAFTVHGVYLPPERVDQLVDDYTAALVVDIAGHSAPYPGLVPALEALTAAGATLCVCTNKRTHLSNLLLDALGLSRHFAAIVGADSVKNRKPHPDHFIAAVRAAHGDPARAMMVGDSINDVATAKAANAPVAVYAHGYTDTAPALLGADTVFNQYDELPDLAVRLLLGPQPTPRT